MNYENDQNSSKTFFQQAISLSIFVQFQITWDRYDWESEIFNLCTRTHDFESYLKKIFLGPNNIYIKAEIKKHLT